MHLHCQCYFQYFRAIHIRKNGYVFIYSLYQREKEREMMHSGCACVIAGSLIRAAKSVHLFN